MDYSTLNASQYNVIDRLGVKFYPKTPKPKANYEIARAMNNTHSRFIQIKYDRKEV